MKRTLVFLAWLFAAISSNAGTRVIPVAGHLPGANNTAWTTDVSLTNNDAVAASAQLVFHADNGTTVSRNVSLPANGSLLLSDAVRPDLFSGANATGWMGQLEIRSGANLSASARTFTTASSGGTYGSAYESYDPSVLAREGAMSGLLHNGRFRSNVAYANATDSVAIVFYTYRGEDGAVAATNQLAIAPHSTTQISLSRDLAARTDDAPVLVEWSSTQPLYAIASVVDNRSNDPTNVPSENSATELFFPVVGRTPGAQSTFWSTSAAVSSRADTAGTVTFAYRDSATGQLFTRTVAIAARGSVRAEDVNTFVAATAGSGSLTITSTVRVVASVRVFNTLADGSTYGSALLAQQSAVRASQISIKGVRRDSAYRLNVSLSGSSAATNGTIRLFDDNGHEVENEPFHVEHGAMTQIALNRGETEVHSGEVKIETNDGAGVTAVASSVDNRTGDTSVRESEQENERHHELEVRVSPSTANAGTVIAFSIGDATGVQSVRWTFGDGATGTGITTTHAYNTAGEFAVSAEVTLANGAVVRDQEDVHILASGGTVNNGPIDFSWSPIAPQPGQLVTFTASRTTDGGSFEWKFPGNVRKSGGVTSFTFPTSGAFEVELELEHAGPATLHATHIVTVGSGSNNGGNPSAIDFTWSPAAPAVGQSVTFTATGGNGGTYVFKFPGNIRKSGNSVTFAFANAGSFEVELELEHAGTETLHASHVITVGGGSNNGGGTATSVDFTYSPSSPRAGQTVTFTASANGALPSGATFKWRLPNDTRPTGTTTTYVFPTAGTYKVRVEIEHGGVENVEREKTIVVAP